MTYQEQLEAIGQTTIFDFLPYEPVKRAKGFEIGDTVKIRYYHEELDFISACHPQLLEDGEIVDKKCDFYRVRIGEVVVDVPGNKLRLI